MPKNECCNGCILELLIFLTLPNFFNSVFDLTTLVYLPSQHCAWLFPGLNSHTAHGNGTLWSCAVHSWVHCPCVGRLLPEAGYILTFVPRWSPALSAPGSSSSVKPFPTLTDRSHNSSFVSVVTSVTTWNWPCFVSCVRVSVERYDTRWLEASRQSWNALFTSHNAQVFAALIPGTMPKIEASFLIFLSLLPTSLQREQVQVALWPKYIDSLTSFHYLIGYLLRPSHHPFSPRQATILSHLDSCHFPHN